MIWRARFAATEGLVDIDDTRPLPGIDWRQPPQFALESNDCDTRRMCAARGLVAGGSLLMDDDASITELTASNDYTGPGAGEVQVTVNDGDSGRSIGVSLQKADVVK